MWKVTNKKNEKILIAFEQKLIIPMFECILDYKKNINNYKSFLDYIDNSSHIKKESKHLLKYTVKRKNDHFFYEYVESLIINELSYIQKQYQLFRQQSLQLNNFDYDINQESVDENVKVIFSKFYYEAFFNNKTLWNFIIGEQFNRDIFHDNFKNENNLEVCPYCDLDTIISPGNYFIEHFLPRSKYPLLSMHPNNLISSCSGCNQSYGKKTDYIIPITSPYKQQIGDFISFNIDKHNKLIKLDSGNDERIDNYIKLLKLVKKYERNNVYNLVDNYGKSIYNICLKNEMKLNEGFDPTIIDDYLSYKKQVLTFATKSIFRDIEEYKAYKKSMTID